MSGVTHSRALGADAGYEPFVRPRSKFDRLVARRESLLRRIDHPSLSNHRRAELQTELKILTTSMLREEQKL